MEIGQNIEALEKTLDKNSVELQNGIEKQKHLQQALEIYESEGWQETCEQVLQPELERLLRAEHDIPIQVNGQYNVVPLSMAKGQANEIILLLGRADVTRKAIIKVNDNIADLRAANDKIIQKIAGGKDV